LIELLVVIGILAVLATITVLVLNPAQLFAQARDSQRISDMGTLKSAISLYLTSSGGSDLDGTSGTFTCGTNYGASSLPVTVGKPGVPFSATIAHTGEFAIDGSGWVPVNLASTTSGSPIPVLPRDPVNGTQGEEDYFYAYACDNTLKTFELNANMESQRYRAGGDDDVESTDGGNRNSTTDDTALYEVGTDAGLNL